MKEAEEYISNIAIALFDEDTYLSPLILFTALLVGLYTFLLNKTYKIKNYFRRKNKNGEKEI